MSPIIISFWCFAGPVFSDVPQSLHDARQRIITVVIAEGISNPFERPADAGQRFSGGWQFGFWCFSHPANLYRLPSVWAQTPRFAVVGRGSQIFVLRRGEFVVIWFRILFVDAEKYLVLSI